MAKLNKETVGRVPETMQPTYKIDEQNAGIVNIGASSRFFKGHMGFFTHRMMQKGHEGYGAVGVNVRNSAHSNSITRTMSEQDNLYTVSRVDQKQKKVEVVSSMKGIISANGSAEPNQAIVNQLAHKNTKIISLTITQGGYYFKNGGLIKDHPDIESCLQSKEVADIRSTIGFVSAAFNQCYQNGEAPPLIMSLDNVPQNGDVMRQSTVEYVEIKYGKEVARYVEENGIFVNTMVDRIVPAHSSDHQAYLSDKFGIDDGIAIKTEPFLQLVVERNGHHLPEFLTKMEDVGVQIVDNVKPYEKTKLRILNGSHMWLGPVAYLAMSEQDNYIPPAERTVYEAMQNPLIADAVSKFMENTAMTLNVPPLTIGKKKDATVEDYIEATKKRLENPAIADPLDRLARNGTTQKLHERIIRPMKALIDNGQPYQMHLFAFAAWTVYQSGVDFAGNKFDIQDQASIDLGIAELASHAHESEEKTMELMKGLNEHNILGEAGREISASHSVMKELHKQIKTIKSHGVTAGLRQIM